MKQAVSRQKRITWIRWALKLSQSNLTTLRPGDWRNLQDDLYDLACGESRGVHPTEWVKHGGGLKLFPIFIKKRFLAAATQEAVGRVQSYFNEIFAGLAEAKGIFSPVSLSSPDKPPPALTIQLVNFGPAEPCRLAIISPDLEVNCCIALAEHIAGSGLTREYFRACDYCHGKYISERKPRRNALRHYCSGTDHAKRAAMKRYKIRNAPKIKKREQKRYKQSNKARA